MNYSRFILPSASEVAVALADAYQRGERCSPEVEEALRAALMPGPKCPNDCPYRAKHSVNEHSFRDRQEAVEISLKLSV